MKDLQAYTTVRRDVDLESTPNRNDDGSYSWSNGQLEILNQPDFGALRHNQVKIRQINNQIEVLNQEILTFDTPTNVLEQEGKGLTHFNQAEIAEEKARLEGLKFKLSQLDKAMLKRGVIPPVNDPEPDIKQPKSKRRWIRWREVLGFFLIWLVGEIFMTYVQWHSLRDGKDIEDMIVRSLSLGVVLFLIHLVGKYYKKVKKPVYLIFLGFSFIMLLTMLIGPLLLNEAYPPLEDTTSVADQWSLTDEVAEPAIEDVSPYPFWVNFYRNNDMLPGIFVFLFFVIMQTFVKRAARSTEEEASLVPLSPEAGTDEVANRRNYYLRQIKQSEDHLHRLNEAQQKAVGPNTNKLQNILAVLQKKQEDMQQLLRDNDHMIMSNELLLKQLELHLNKYKTEYLDVLKNDQVKGLVLQPSWPNTADLKTYFNLN